ncbi:MAG: nucleoside triphosphate pyrophosphohydrolase [Acidimicrobiales bacterium]|nr:nucleoside triphosphate pyrophosphohydrolase [Hyphomonadaceae bacterium]RZV38167.1 MAG: nucleoside triphosphate pyrophosphohydrolase [Acidimicrobiales bacterium]
MDIEAEFQKLGKTPAVRLKAMMARLRDPENGCPWDVEQTFKTIAPYTIEEAYEVSQAIDNNDLGELKEELGDLLLQVVFHAQMASELGEFTYDEVSDAIVRKMISRHPHVFGDVHERNAIEQTVAWEETKAQERKLKGQDSQKSILDGVAAALPALMRAEKLQKRAARVGFDWPNAQQVIDKITEEANELVEARDNGESQERIHEEMGDLLFAVTNLARKLGVDPEHALRDTNLKFTKRFTYIEDNSKGALNEMSLDDMESLWQQAKGKV